MHWNIPAGERGRSRAHQKRERERFLTPRIKPGLKALGLKPEAKPAEADKPPAAP